MYADGERTRFTTAHWWCLLAITAVALALRLIGVREWSLWIDEAHTWRDATQPLAGPDGFLGSGRAEYPLAFLLLRGLLALGLADTEAGLRAPFVAIGTLTVPLVAICGRRLIGSWPAVFAAALLAVHPWHVFWSQSARGYAVLVLVAVIAVDRAFAYVRRDRVLDLAIAWLAIGVGALSHATGGMLGLGFLLFLVARRKTLDAKRIVLVVVSSIVCLAAVLLTIKALDLFGGFMKSKGSPLPLHLVETTGFYFGPVQLLMAVVGLWLLGHFGGRDRALLLGSLLVATFGTLLVVGSMMALVTARYAISVLPVVTWLAAFAASHVASALARAPGLARAPRVAAAVLLPLLLTAAHAVPLVDYYRTQYGQRARWREAADFLRTEAKGRAIRVWTINQPSMLYYLRPGQWTNTVPPQYARNQVVPLIEWMIWDGVDQEKKLVCKPGIDGHLAWHREQAEQQNALFAIVVTLPELEEKDYDKTVAATIQRECRVVLLLPCWVGPKDESIYVYMFREP